MLDLVVECRTESGRTELPVRFGRPGHMREVVETLDSWQGEDHRYFRVRADDGSVYILRHDLAEDVWRVHFFERSS
jgi:hypothetical protein